MKKIAVLVLSVVVSVLFLASCQSAGPKCPGMYGQAETQEVILAEQ